MNPLIRKAAMICLAVSAVMTIDRSALAGEFVGVRQIAAPSKARGRDLAVTVWYPADKGGTPVTLGDTAFFLGTSAMADAPIAAGEYPLILLSHGAGLGGTPQAMSWIATPLAKAGFIVAAPAHPGNGGAYRSAEETIKLWLRPGDITSTLDAVESDAALKQTLQARRVGVLGLSMGGNTALLLAGARIDPVLLAGYCDTDGLNASLCGWMRQSGVDLHAIDMKPAGRDYSDKRIRFAMAIDPAPVDVLRADSFANIDIPVEIVNLGQPGHIPRTTLASGVAKAVPEATYATIADASHYSMFGECKPGAAKLAAAEDIDDPICSDGTGHSRLKIHQQLVRMVTDAFDRALKASR